MQDRRIAADIFPKPLPQIGFITFSDRLGLQNLNKEILGIKAVELQDFANRPSSGFH